MNIITPFSGLSLVVHLLIIGVAKLAKLILKNNSKVFHMPIKVTNVWARYRGAVLPVLSIFVISIVTFAVSVSTTVAVRTGIREGARETHVEFISKRYASLERLQKNFASKKEHPVSVRKYQTENYSKVNYESDIFRPVVKNVPNTSNTTLQPSLDDLIIGNKPFISYQF